MKDFQGLPQTSDVVDLLVSRWDWDADLLDDISGHNGTAVNQAYLDPYYSQLTKDLHLAYTGADDKVSAFSNGGQIFIAHVAGA